MMAGRRLWDAAMLANASKHVAQQHFRLRREQIDLWSKTSTIGKAVKNQTDRVTLTIAAARALAERLDEKTPYATWMSSNKDGAVPREETVKSPTTDSTDRQGLNQDHHYTPSPENTTKEPVPTDDISIKQEEASRYPTPDGTIPPAGAPVDIVNPSKANQDVGTERAEAPRQEPLTGAQESDALKPRTGDRPAVDPPSPGDSSIPRMEAVPEQEVIPEGINTDVFHSPKISRLLGGRRKPGELGLSGSAPTPFDKSPTALGHDQDTFNVRRSGSDKVAEPHPLAKDGKVKMASTERDDVQSLAADISNDVDSTMASNAAVDVDEPTSVEHNQNKLRESRVPSSRIGRLWQYGGLATGMAFGAVSESLKRMTGGSSSGSLMLSAANMDRLVAKLSRMRGAALKLGQMISFQDSKMLPGPIHDVLSRVQDSADYMPPAQRDQVLRSNLGDQWRSLFSEFQDIPIAAASIGQVHKAKLASDGRQVAVKIQYPGVATSISSDLNNLSVLLTASRLLPKGLYLDKTIANARTELAWECDYQREAECQRRFSDLIKDDTDTFTVPEIIEEACGPQVLTAEFMSGLGVTKPALNLTQEQRNWIGTNILRLCLRELMEFKFMQTDPNWTNFLFNAKTNKLELLDFGAAREFPDKFVDPYVRILIAASQNDRKTVKELSVQLGYLTGHESSAMVQAHVDSVMTLAEPFKASQDPDLVYDFRDQTITDRVRSFIPVMLRERLSPPPEETYSLHRKLSGAFLLLAKLGSQVQCRKMFVQAVDKWESKDRTI